jgi:hypothetical protein
MGGSGGMMMGAGGSLATGGGGAGGGTGGSGGGVLCALTEDFTTWPPPMWSIVDGGTTADTWEHCDPLLGSGCDEGEFTIATGPFAAVNSDAAGIGPVLDEELVTPTLDCSGASTVTLDFDHNYQYISADFGHVDVSTNGGGSWTTLASYEADTSTNGEHVTLSLTTVAAGQPSVIIRFRYSGSYDWWWMVDSVVLTSN